MDNNRAGREAGKRKSVRLPLIAISVFVISLVPIIWMCVYARPMADDYSYGASTYHLVQSGNWNLLTLVRAAIQVSVDSYYDWQGTYASIVIMALHPAIFGERYYFIGLWLLMMVLFLSVMCIVFCVARILRIQKYRLPFTIFLYAVFYNGLTDDHQGIYWYNGAWHYIFFFALILVNMSLLLHFLFSGNRRDMMMSIFISFFLSFLISGGNAVTAFLNIMIMLVFALFFQAWRRPLYYLPLLSAVGGFLVQYVAPGNAVRQQYFQRQGFFQTLLHSIWECYEYICRWINIQWLLFVVLLIVVSVYIAANGHVPRQKESQPLLLMFCSLMILCGMLSVAYMPTGTSMQGRTVNSVWLTFMCLTAVNTIYISSYFFLRKEQLCDKLRDVIDNAAPAGWLLILCCCGVCFFRDANSVAAANEIVKGRAQAYAAACDERYEQIKNDSEDEPLRFTELPTCNTFGTTDITDDPEDWINQSWEEYYGKKVLLLRADE